MDPKNKEVRPSNVPVKPIKKIAFFTDRKDVYIYEDAEGTYWLHG